MIDQLFGSKTRAKLLQLFFSNPNRAFYVREITRKIEEQINSVRRELSNLLTIGIITSDTNNNRLYYEVNQEYEFYEPLLAIFGGKAAAVGKTAVNADSKVDELSDLKALGNIEMAIFTGQFTRDELSGIDFLLVGNINQNKLQKYITSLETQEGKEIRYTLMPLHEFEYRRQIKDRFIANVLTAKKQVLIDKHNILD